MECSEFGEDSWGLDTICPEECAGMGLDCVVEAEADGSVGENFRVFEERSGNGRSGTHRWRPS